MDTKLVFCIDCQEVANMECEPLCGHILYIPVRDESGFVMGADVDFCDMIGGFAYCPPPVVDPNWIDYVVEPGEEVLIEEKSFYFDPELPEEAIYLLMGRGEA